MSLSAAVLKPRIIKYIPAPILSWRMNETSGPVSDYSGNGYTGRVDGTPTRNATVYGGNKGMQLTASGHGVSIDKGACPLAVAALESQTCTISMVFENTSSGTANPSPFIIWNSASGGFPTLRLGNITPAYANWSSLAGSQNYGNIGDGTVTGLKIITYVKTPSEGRLYVDGVLVATKVHSPSVFPATSSSDRIQVGGHLNFPESYQYTGRVSDLNIWDVALTASEVATLASLQGRTPDQRTNIDPYAPLVAYLYHFDSSLTTDTVLENFGYAGNSEMTAGCATTSNPLFGTKSGSVLHASVTFGFTNRVVNRGSATSFCHETSWRYDGSNSGQNIRFLSIQANGWIYRLGRNQSTGFLNINGVTTSFVISAGVYNRYALVLDGTNLIAYVNGQEQGRVTVTALSGTSVDVYFPSSQTGAFWASGNHDECRFTLGTPRYFSNYTPSTAAFPNP
jgi:hypothetical protein